MDGPLLPIPNAPSTKSLSCLTGIMKNHQLVQDLYFKIVNTFAKIDVELANMLFAQSDSFLRNLDAEDGTCLLFALCKCRK